MFRLSRIEAKVSYATKAEHDFSPPEDFDRRDYASRADWQMGTIEGPAKVFLRERIAWLVERDYGKYGTLPQGGQGRRRPGPGRDLRDRVRVRAPARLLGPELARERHPARARRAGQGGRRAPRPAAQPPPAASSASPTSSPAPLPEPNGRARSNGRSESVIRPERFARLVSLAGLLIGAAREDARLQTAQVLDELNVSMDELREDIDVLNVVNFGGGTYVLYAEITGSTRSRSTPTPTATTSRRPRAPAAAGGEGAGGRDRPVRRPPARSRACGTARDKIVAALGHDPSEEGLEIAPGPRRLARSSAPSTTRSSSRRLLELHYYKENEDEFTKRRVEPYKLASGPRGLVPGLLRPRARGHPALPARPDEGGDGSPTRRSSRARGSTSASPSRSGWSAARSRRAGVARVWVAPERARWLREERRVVEELADGGVVVELPYGSVDWLVRETLKGVGDLVVLEPDEARERRRRPRSRPPRSARHALDARRARPAQVGQLARAGQVGVLAEAVDPDRRQAHARARRDVVEQARGRRARGRRRRRRARGRCSSGRGRACRSPPRAAVIARSKGTPSVCDGGGEQVGVGVREDRQLPAALAELAQARRAPRRTARQPGSDSARCSRRSASSSTPSIAATAASERAITSR